MRKELLGTFIITALILSSTLTSVSIASPGSKPFVSVDPQTTEIGVGLNFDINVTVTNVTSLYSFEINMSFNPDVLSCTGVQEGPFLNQGGTYPSWWTVHTINNDDGWVHFSDLLFGAPESGTSGNGTLATVNFQAETMGSSFLNFTEPTTLSKMVGGVGQVIPQDPPVNGTVTVTGGHDAAVLSITAPTEAASSSSVPIDVTVKNEGSSTEVVNVTISYDTTYINSQNVTLDGGNSTIVSFSWDTTNVAADTYDINATATIPVDDDSTDNSKTTTIRIVEHDVAVTDVDAPNKAKVGATVSINVTVENQGNATENLNVTVSYDADLIGFNDTVALPAQNSTIVSFNWNTAGLDEDTYDINATAIIPTIPVDDDSTDNSKTTTITLYLLHDVNVTSIEAPTYARYDLDGNPVGDIVSINVTVKNEGDFDEEDINVTISYENMTGFDFYIDSQNVTLTKGENQTALFTWNTTDLSAGNYPVKANATIPVDDNLVDNTRTKVIILTIHDVAVVNITGRSVIYPNFTVSINVTVKNEGSFRETVNLTLKYDGFLIGNTTFDLVIGMSLNVSFTWNTTSLSYGNYTLNATATVLESVLNPDGIDDDPADNTLYSEVTVTILGDINGDGTINFADFITFAADYGTCEGEAGYDVVSDLTGDGCISFADFIKFAANYGKSI